MQKNNIILLIISSLVLTPLQSQAKFDLIKGLGIAGSTLFAIVLLNSNNREKNPLDDEIDEKSKKIEEKIRNFEEYKKTHNNLLSLKTKLNKLIHKKECNQKHIELIKSNISGLEKNKQNNINSILRYGSTLGAIAGGLALYILIYKYINQTVSPEKHHLRIMKVRAEITRLERALIKVQGTNKEKNVATELSKKKILLQSLENQQMSPNSGMPSLKSIFGLVATIATSGIASWKLVHILFPHHTPTSKETQRIKNYKTALENIQNQSEMLTEKIEAKDIEITLFKQMYPEKINQKMKKELTKLIQEKQVLETQQTHILGENQSTNNPLGGLADLIKSISLYA